MGGQNIPKQKAYMNSKIFNPDSYNKRYSFRHFLAKQIQYIFQVSVYVQVIGSEKGPLWSFPKVGGGEVNKKGHIHENQVIS